MSVKIQLLLLGPLVVLVSLSSGASLKTHEYILRRQPRSASAASDHPSASTQDQLEPRSARFPRREYSFDPRPNIDPEALIPNYNGNEDNEAEQFSDAELDSQAKESPSAPSSQIPSDDVEIINGTPLDFVHYDGDAFMTGREFHKIYSALDSIAQFIPVKLTHMDSEQKPDHLSDGDVADSNSSHETSEGETPHVEEQSDEELPPSDSEITFSEVEVSENSSDPNVNSFNNSSPHGQTVNDNEPRAILGVSHLTASGASYIIHPDNLPPPTYRPMENLPPPSRPAAKWRPDIFMKVCCSEPDSQDPSDSDISPSSLEVKTGYSQVDTMSSSSPPEKKDTAVENSDDSVRETDDQERSDSSEVEVINGEELIVEDKPIALSLIMNPDNDTLKEPLNITGIYLDNDTSSQPEVSGNHTPRYEESGSTYQDVTNFLKDIASSEGFQNAFLGDLIKNFGDLDQNAMKLIYSLLIRPLEGASKNRVKSDRMGAAPDSNNGGPNRLPEGEDFVVLGKDRLPLRDHPANGYHPFAMLPPRSQPRPKGRPQQIRPSSLVRQVLPVTSEKDWRPVRTQPRLPSNGRLGDEHVDVITAPPFQTFEVVLGSSLNHDESKPAPQNLPGNRWGAPPPSSPQTSPPGQNSNGLPFDKLTLGLEMPPQDALDALPPGSMLIPPSQILNQPNLPHVFTNKDGTPSLQIPLSELQPNLPFFGGEKPQRFRPPAKPQVHDIPQRLPSFLSSLFPLSRPKPPQRAQNSGPMLQRPFVHPGLQGPMFPNRQRPTGPPPIVTKMTPPGPRDDHSHRQPSLTVDVPPASSDIVPVRNEENENYNSFVRPLNPTGVHVSGPVPVPAFVPRIPETETSTTSHPVGVPGNHNEHNIEYSHFMPHPTTNQPHAPNFDMQQASLEHNGNYASEGQDYSTNEHVLNHAEESTQQESDETYYRDPPVDYIIDYYDYRDYYDDQLRGPGNPPGDTVETAFQSNEDYGAGETQIFSEDSQGEATEFAATVSPLITMFDTISFEDMLMGNQPAVNTATLTEQEKNDLQMLLQNHRMANAIAEANGTVFDMLPDMNMINISHPSHISETNVPANFDAGIEDPDNRDHYMVPLHDPQVEVSQYVPPSLSAEPSAEVEYSEHEASIAHLWNNIQLIPLAPELFETPQEENTMNLTALFNDAVPLSPDISINEIPNLGSDIDRISIDNSDGRIFITEEIDEKADAKFMAYILIGACCGLALLSIAGVIVIVRFKKTCGSRQIRTRTRLTEQDSIENISRHVENLTLGGDSGHKLGSWFTGRNEHIGSGKLRSNMTLPTVHDLKRDKNSKSGSTRDLLSISSESSQASSPRQGHRGGEETIHNEDEEPRTSWLHDEYRASLSDLSQAPGQDLAYIPRQYQQRASHDASQQSPSHAERQRYRDVTHESEQAERSSRERRYTGQSRVDAERPPNRRHFVSSMESEELDERLDQDNRYTTDSEVEDWTTNYEDESREPSRYLSDSRELDDTVARRNDPITVTSQELGDQLSRDLKQYQSRRGDRSRKEHRESSHNPESSQEMDAEDASRELQRSQSQVSFSRDNVQNEVFLEFDNIFRQHGQYLNGEAPASTLGRLSRATEDTQFSASRANTPDSIDLPDHHSHDGHLHGKEPPPSPPTTPPRFSPPPPPPRPPKPGHLSQPGTPSPRADRARPPSPGQSPPSPPRNQRPVYWTSEEERLI